MASERRRERVTELIREVIAGFLLRELPREGPALVTVTRVECSVDLFYAHIFVTILGSADEETALLEHLRRITPTVQHALNRTLRMRPVPKITFSIDTEEKRRERIEKLLSDNSSAH